MFIIHETQMLDENTLVPVEPAVVKADYNEAMSVYHSKMASAAVSTVPVHSVYIENEFGVQIESGFFDHREKPEEPNVV